MANAGEATVNCGQAVDLIFVPASGKVAFQIVSQVD